jgi:hypothetical protein
MDADQGRNIVCLYFTNALRPAIRNTRFIIAAIVSGMANRCIGVNGALIGRKHRALAR